LPAPDGPMSAVRVAGRTIPHAPASSVFETCGDGVSVPRGGGGGGNGRQEPKGPKSGHKNHQIGTCLAGAPAQKKSGCLLVVVEKEESLGHLNLQKSIGYFGRIQKQ